MALPAAVSTWIESIQRLRDRIEENREESYPFFVLTSLLRLRHWYALGRFLHIIGLAAAASLVSVEGSLVASRFVFSLLALYFYAQFGLVSNDLFDERFDRRVGSTRPVHGLPDWLKWILMLAPIPPGLWFANRAGMSLVLYACAMVANLLYVGPRVRLKGRGASGFVACVLASHLAPGWLLVGAFPMATDLAIGFLSAVTLVGILELLAHQLQTFERDLGIDQTWVIAVGRERAEAWRSRLVVLRSLLALSLTASFVVRRPEAVLPVVFVLLANLPAGTSEGFLLLALPERMRRFSSFRLPRYVRRIPLKELAFALMLSVTTVWGPLGLYLLVCLLVDRQWHRARMAHLRWLLLAADPAKAPTG